MRLREPGVLLVEPELVAKPECRGAGEQRTGANEIEVAGPCRWEIHVAHGFERNAHDDPERAPLGLHEREDGHAAGNLVRERLARQREHERHGQRDGYTWTDATLRA